MTSIDQYRQDTPGCQHKIHFNNAGASLMPASVIEAQKTYLDLEAITGGYETADLQAEAINAFYDAMARLINSAPHNLCFTSSATNSFARALSSIPFQRGDSILIANEDYISNQLTLLSLQKRLGVQLLRAESLPEGGVDLDNMKQQMDRHRPRLVSISHVPTNTGLIQPVEAVGTLCRERDILYLVDGCQSIGQFRIDVRAIQCDFFTGTFRKFLRGPRGTGFLYVSDEVLQQELWPLHIDMRGADWTGPDSFQLQPDARRFEDWELPYSLVMGSRAAAEYALRVGLDEIQERNEVLCKKVRAGLSRLGLRLMDRGASLGSIITVAVPGKKPEDVLHQLRSRNINTSIASRSSAVIDFDAKGVSWALRISPHYYNTEQEIELLLQGIKEII
ncbi:MAG: aminotransferase class V-fold PLP-dependent enzyme [Cytophagales bacterium]|nr:aminotransferase class V-fold PLP-dependent enzyme [Cytophagales bacterium]